MTPILDKHQTTTTVFTLTIVLLTIFTKDTTALCEDTDVSLCTLMVNRIPQICSDPCLSKYCRRTCGKCPLKCFTCESVAMTSQCTNIQTCPSSDDYCFAVQTFTDRFTEAYKLGCGSRQTCLQYSTSGTNGAHFEAGCCDSDNCNNKPPRLLHVTKNETNIVPSWHLNVCANRDDEVCRRLSAYFIDVCAEGCIANKLCPKLCNKCFSCLDCKDVKDPSQCTTTTVCGAGKLCYGFEKIRPDFSTSVQLGCVSEKFCNTINSPGSHIFGKRNFALNGNCCNGDRCNAHPLSQTTSFPTTTRSTTTLTMTTRSPTIPSTTKIPYPTTPSSCHVRYQQYTCPSNYEYLGSSCFSKRTIITSNMSKESAEQYCNQNCGRLVSFKYGNDLYVLKFYIYPHPYIEFWSDMVRDDNNRWIWRHDQSSVSQDLISKYLRVKSPDHRCVLGRIDYNFQTRDYYYTLKTCSCDENHRPLCELIRY